MRVFITLDGLRPNLVANTEFDCCNELSPMIWSGDGPARDLAFLGRPCKFPVCLKSSLGEVPSWVAALGLLSLRSFWNWGGLTLSTSQQIGCCLCLAGSTQCLLAISVLFLHFPSCVNGSVVLALSLFSAFALPSTSPFLQVSHHLWGSSSRLRALLVSFLRLRLTRAVVPSGFCHPPMLHLHWACQSPLSLNSVTTIIAHVTFVGQVCERYVSLQPLWKSLFLASNLLRQGALQHLAGVLFVFLLPPRQGSPALWAWRTFPHLLRSSP